MVIFINLLHTLIEFFKSVNCNSKLNKVLRLKKKKVINFLIFSLLSTISILGIFLQTTEILFHFHIHIEKNVWKKVLYCISVKKTKIWQYCNILTY